MTPGQCFFCRMHAFPFSLKVFVAPSMRRVFVGVCSMLNSLQSWIPYQLNVQIATFHLLSIGLGFCSTKFLFKDKVKYRSGRPKSLLLHASYLNLNRMISYSERQQILWKKCDYIIKGFRRHIQKQGRRDIRQTKVAHTGLILELPQSPSHIVVSRF